MPTLMSISPRQAANRYNVRPAHAEESRTSEFQDITYISYLVLSSANTTVIDVREDISLCEMNMIDDYTCGPT